MAAPTDPAPKVLIVTTVHWPATTRLGLALARSGCRVAAVAPARHALRRLDAVAASFTCWPHFGLDMTVAQAIDRWSPDFVVPADDRALSSLHRLHARAILERGRNAARRRAVIETSLGDPRGFDLAARKSAFVAMAAAEGLRVPQTTVVRDLADLRRRLATAAFPQVLKVDGSWGGQGVRIVRTREEAEDAFLDFAAPPPLRRIAKQIAQHWNFTPLGDRLCGRAPTVTLQDYVDGRPANRAVACWNGEILAGLSVEVVRTSGATGPASVVRVVEHPELDDITRRMVRRLGLSGFCGLDVILDDAGRAHVIELNARPTQLCHLALDETSDMTGALYAKLARAAQRRMIAVKHDVITLFPQELWHDPQSKFLFQAHHDVPWDEPRLIAAYLRPDPPGWVDQMLQMLRGAPPLDEPDAEPLERET